MPGTLYTIVPDLAGPETEEDSAPSLIDGHKMDPLSVLRLARTLGKLCPRILLVGCEPAAFGGDDGSMEMSQPVEAAVNAACDLVLSLVAAFLQERESIAPVGQLVPAD